LPQIADRANELHNRLVEIYQQLLSAKDALPSEHSTQVRAEDIRERKLFADALIKGIPTSLDLRDEDQYWVSLNRQFTSERKILDLTRYLSSGSDSIPRGPTVVWQATLDQYTECGVSKAW